MTTAIPVIDLEAAEDGDVSQLDAMRAATEELGAVQVVNHGVPQDLAADLSARMDRLLSLPRAEKATLASPHPYRGWRQWPDDFGRLELERFNVAQFDDVEAARAAGLAEDHLGLYAHANMWPAGDPGLRDTAFGYIGASRRLAGRMLGLYAAAQGLPADAFGLGALPHLRLTVNDYPPGGGGRHGDPPVDGGLRLPGPGRGGRAAPAVRSRLRRPAGPGVGARQGPGGGLPGRVRPPRPDRRVARRPALRRRTGGELCWPLAGWPLV